jgi:hypothetical protein
MPSRLAQWIKQPMKCEAHPDSTRSCSWAAEPWFSRLVFGDFRFAPVWLVLRLWLGWQWLEAGWEKVNDPAWMQTGAAVQKFWERAIVVPEVGRPPVAYDWYRAFLQALLADVAGGWALHLVRQAGGIGERHDIAPGLPNSKTICNQVVRRQTVRADKRKRGDRCVGS